MEGNIYIFSFVNRFDTGVTEGVPKGEVTRVIYTWMQKISTKQRISFVCEYFIEMDS